MPLLERLEYIETLVLNRVQPLQHVQTVHLETQMYVADLPIVEQTPCQQLWKEELCLLISFRLY